MNFSKKRWIFLGSVLAFIVLAQNTPYTNNNSVSAPNQVNEIERRFIVNQKTIRDAQDALSSNGYTVPLDGILDPITENAIRQFQMNNELSPTGQLDGATLKALGVEPDQSLEQ